MSGINKKNLPFEEKNGGFDDSGGICPPRQINGNNQKCKCSRGLIQVQPCRLGLKSGACQGGLLGVIVRDRYRHVFARLICNHGDAPV